MLTLTSGDPAVLATTGDVFLLQLSQGRDAALADRTPPKDQVRGETMAGHPAETISGARFSQPGVSGGVMARCLEA